MCNQNIISNKFDLNLSTTLSSYRGQGALNRVWGASTALTVRLGKNFKKCREDLF